MWRSIKLIEGENNIENKNLDNYNSLKNPFFILDFTFALLGYLCVISSRQINKKFTFLTLLIFIIAWYLYFKENFKTSKIIHFCGHCYVIIIIYLTFFLYIR